MKILALEHELPAAANGACEPHLKAEAMRLWQLYQSGQVRELYFRPDAHTAVLLLECAGVADAKLRLETLPLVQAGLIAFEVIPLAPYSGFARLFEDRAADHAWVW